MNPQARPSATGFWVAGCLPLGISVVSVVLFTLFVMTGFTELGAIQGPIGTVTVQVPAAGDYQCFAEGEGWTPQRANFGGLTLATAAGGGSPITTGLPQGDVTYTFAARHGVAVRDIHFPAAGSYTLETQWTGEAPSPSIATRLVIADYNIAAMALTMLGGCCGTFLAVLGGGILAFVTWKRRADWDKLYGPMSHPPAGFPPGAAPTAGLGFGGGGGGDFGRAGGVNDEWPEPSDESAPPRDPYRPSDDPPPPDDGDRLY